MSTENWEEINELDFEDDLAHRITVHSVVHHLNVTNDSNCNEVEELEYQLVQAHKQPTYAAAAKWGIHKKNKKSIDINSVDNVKDIGKDNVKEKKKETKNNNNNNKNNKDKEQNLLNGDHEVDYEECNLANSPSKQSSPNINPSTPDTPDTSTPVTPAPTSRTSISTEPDSQDYCKSASRRHNNHVHKLSTQRLLEQISNPIIIELNASAVKGDTNRNPEYKKYKLLKKSLRYKNGSGKIKDRKNNTDKRVEVW